MAVLNGRKTFIAGAVLGASILLGLLSPLLGITWTGLFALAALTIAVWAGKTKWLPVFLLLLLPSFVSAQRPVAADGTTARCGRPCGKERWLVKAVADQDSRLVDTVAVWTTVAKLRGIKAPTSLPEDRRVAPFEFRTYKVHAWIIGWKTEVDRDFHIVIADSAKPNLTMIVEVPDTVCRQVCRSLDRWQMAAVRLEVIQALGNPSTKYHRFTPPRWAIITGIAFFDKIHGQTGVAPNGIELHPLLSFRSS